MNSIAHRMERYMDLLAERQKLIASNIANAATPGYKTRDIDFQFEYRAALGEPESRLGRLHVVEPLELKSGNDGNNVSLDRESRLLAETAIRFQAASSLWRSQMKAVRMAIQEGRNG